MAIAFATPNTLIGTLRAPENAAARLVTSLVITVLGTALLALSARLMVPFIPVPATFQTFTVAVLAAAFGWRIGVATIALYIVEGLSGLPVFAGGGGAHYILSPTFGFIAGWLATAFIIGYAADKGASQKALPLFFVMVLGNLVAFVTGYLWLVAMSGGTTWIDQTNVLGSAFDIAVKPFLLWDGLKMVLAALTVSGGWAFVRSRKD